MQKLSAADVVIVITLAIVSCYLGGVTALEDVWRKARRCCSPDQWEADVRNIGTTTRYRDHDFKLSGKFVFDYTNQRWAFSYQDLSNQENSRRLVFDHKQNHKFLASADFCYKVPLNMKEMDRYCVPINATHHGYYDYGLNRNTVDYDVWSYEMLGIPVRIILRTTRENCIPLQDGAVTVIRNSWQWKEGEPVCVPWEFPERAFSGDCFKSHKSQTTKVSGTRPSGPLYNMDFRNINLTISNENLFDVPSDCQQLDDWPDDIQFTTIFGILFKRMKIN